MQYITVCQKKENHFLFDYDSFRYWCIRDKPTETPHIKHMTKLYSTMTLPCLIYIPSFRKQIVIERRLGKYMHIQGVSRRYSERCLFYFSDNHSMTNVYLSEHHKAVIKFSKLESLHYTSHFDYQAWFRSSKGSMKPDSRWIPLRITWA